MTDNGPMRLLPILVVLAAAGVTALALGTAKADDPGAGTGASFHVECAINGVFVADPIAKTSHEHIEAGATPFETASEGSRHRALDRIVVD